MDNSTLSPASDRQPRRGVPDVANNSKSAKRSPLLANLRRNAEFAMAAYRAIAETYGIRYFNTALMGALGQVVQTVSSFLPIKILIILGSERNPAYLRYIETHLTFLSGHLDRTHVAMLFALLVPITYALYIFLHQRHTRTLRRQRQQIDKGREPLTVAGKRLTARNVAHVHGFLASFQMNALIVLISFAIALIAAPLFGLYMVGGFAAYLLVTFYFVLGRRRSSMSRIPHLTKRHFVEYSGSVFFVLSLFVLLGYVLATGTEIYIAILALVFFRRALRATQRSIRDALQVRGRISLSDD